MRRSLVLVALPLLLVSSVTQAQQRTLRPFTSDAELRAALDSLIRRAPGVAVEDFSGVGVTSAPAGTALARSSITSTQHDGVDEGGIVKVHGDHLVILRRGRLFTVRHGGGRLEPVDAADAYGAGVDGSGTWYDELLISGDDVIVIGYSYARGGTEVGRFSLDRAGRLRHRSTHHLRSFDYYSSRNYASRLIGSRLIFYAPVPLRRGRTLDDVLPAMREWRGDAAAPFRRTLSARRVFAAPSPIPPAERAVFHTVTSCDLARPALSCESTAVLGPAGHVFYVSPGAVYVWTTPRSGRVGDGRSASTLYRLPLDGASPTALRTSGSPVDVFSFLEDTGGHLNVLLVSQGRGDWMWGAERAGGHMALLRVPIASFGDGREAAPEAAYRPLPPMDARHGPLQNRYVGDHVLYGRGADRGMRSGAPAVLHAVHYRTGRVSRLTLPHGVDRIERMGRDAVVIGADLSDLHFTGVALGESLRVVQRWALPGAVQGETRSHGFFYREARNGTGILGLPVRGGIAPGPDPLRRSSAGVTFVENARRAFRPLGTLASSGEEADDACVASCVDWYGNARPIFLDGRVFALLGYEIVEGRLSDGALREVRRVDFTPTRRTARWP